MRFETPSSVLVILFVATMFFGCHDELNPKYGFDHVAFEIPVRVTDAPKTFSFSFSTTYSSRLYRFLISCKPETEHENKALPRCLSNGRYTLFEGNSEKHADDFGRDVSYSTFRDRVFIVVTSSVTLSPGIEYTFEASLPDFNSDCNSLEPVLILAVGPSPSL